MLKHGYKALPSGTFRREACQKLIQREEAGHPTHVGLVAAEEHGPFEDQLHLVVRVLGRDVNGPSFSPVVDVALPGADVRFLFDLVPDEAGRGLECHLPTHHLDSTAPVVVVLRVLEGESDEKSSPRENRRVRAEHMVVRLRQPPFTVFSGPKGIHSSSSRSTSFDNRDYPAIVETKG